MLNELLERKIAEAAEWFCDNPNCSDIEDALRELVAEAMSIENEACAKIADKYTCGTCGMDGKSGREIRTRPNAPGEPGATNDD